MAQLEVTLYSRLGGDKAVESLIAAFFDEIMKVASLRPFFENISISALRVHQLKLFKVLYGRADEQPDQDVFMDYMLATHTRLFRDMGLDETHFDQVAECLLRAFQSKLIPVAVTNDCLQALVPLRAVFEFGARVAREEKKYTPDELQMLPTATAKNMHLPEPSALPDPAMIEIPDWLLETLQKKSESGVVRVWTKHLIDAFGREGDSVIADTFLDMPYMNHHVYVATLLQMAFFPEDIGDGSDTTRDELALVQVVKYPRGPHHKALSQSLFERMVTQVKDTCHYFLMDDADVEAAVIQLRSYKNFFSSSQLRMVGGVFTPHVLRKQAPKLDVSKVKQDKSDVSTVCSDADTYSEASNHSLGDDLSEQGTSGGNRKSMRKGKSVWRRLLGWTKIST